MVEVFARAVDRSIVALTTATNRAEVPRPWCVVTENRTAENGGGAYPRVAQSRNPKK